MFDLFSPFSTVSSQVDMHVGARVWFVHPLPGDPCTACPACGATLAQIRIEGLVEWAQPSRDRDGGVLETVRLKECRTLGQPCGCVISEPGDA